MPHYHNEDIFNNLRAEILMAVSSCPGANQSKVLKMIGRRQNDEMGRRVITRLITRGQIRAEVSKGARMYLYPMGVVQEIPALALN